MFEQTVELPVIWNSDVTVMYSTVRWVFVGKGSSLSPILHQAIMS